MSLPPCGDDSAADFEGRAVELRAHVEEIAPALRGLPFADAEQRLRDELRARGVETTETQIGSIARMAADPSWPLRHPVQYRRWWREQDERIRRHNLELEVEERRRLVELWGEEEADALLAVDPVSEAVGRVMDELDGACSFSVVPPDSHDGRRHLVLVSPYSRRLAKRIERAVVRTGFNVDVRELTEPDLPPWRRS